MKKGRKIWLTGCLVASMWLMMPWGVKAAGDYMMQGVTVSEEDLEKGEALYQESIDQLMNELDFEKVDDFLSDSSQEIESSFTELMSDVIQQGGQVDKKWFVEKIFDILARELKESRPLFVQILTMSIAFALLNNFAAVFKNSQIRQTCFFIYYLALITLLMKSYLIASELLLSVTENLVEFMQALIPAFCMALSFSTAISTSAVLYQLILVVIFLIQNVLIHFVVPGIHIYIVLHMLNLMTEENMLSKITELIKKLICWSLKLLVGAVTGLNVLQNLIAPAIDSLKNTALTKALGAVPGLGGAANAVTEMFFGAAVVIKNGIGVTALVILLMLALAPLVKLAFLTFMYKLIGAVIQPVADKRVCECIDGVGEGVNLLLKVLGTCLLMFMISVAMVTASVR